MQGQGRTAEAASTLRGARRIGTGHCGGGGGGGSDAGGWDAGGGGGGRTEPMDGAEHDCMSEQQMCVGRAVTPHPCLVLHRDLSVRPESPLEVTLRSRFSAWSFC